MIIDLILDRKDGKPYNPKDFYNEVMEYNGIFDHIGDDITRAMDGGTDEDIRKALCDYILKQGYNPEICDYINGEKWIDEEQKTEDEKAIEALEAAGYKPVGYDINKRKCVVFTSKPGDGKAVIIFKYLYYNTWMESVENLINGINPMCVNCGKFRNGCNGEKNQAYTGCVYKEEKR